MHYRSILLPLCAAACLPAMAQDSANFFGALDVSLSHYRVSSRDTTGAAQQQPLSKSLTGMFSNSSAPSRIGWRGQERISDTLSVGFWLEAGLANMGTGAGFGSNGSLNFNRRSTLSLHSKTWGELRLGRDNTVSYWNDALFSPFGTLGAGSNLVSAVGSNLQQVRGPGSATAANDNYMRTNRAIAYLLPSNAAGWYGQVQYAKQLNDAGVSSAKGRYTGLRLGKKTGAFDIAAVAAQSIAAKGAPERDGAGAATGVLYSEKIQTLSIGAAYQWGKTRFSTELSQVTDKRDIYGNGLSASTKDRYRGILLGLQSAMGANGVLKLAYSQVQLSAANDQNAKVQRLAVGYEYALSKRTALYATAAKTLISNGQHSLAIMAVRPTSSLPYPATASGAAPRSSMGYDFGIRHNF